MLKGIFCATAATLLSLATSNVFADNGVPATSTLDQMGLAGIQVMSDSDALAIRGKGYRHRSPSSSAEAWGNSSANVGAGFSVYGLNVDVGSNADNGYSASGRRMAQGGTESFAGVVIEKTRTHGYGRRTHVSTKSLSLTFVGGGSSFAKAR